MGKETIGECIVLDQPLDLAGVHVALLPTGRVLFFSYDQYQENEINRGLWQLWDPNTGPLQLQVLDRNLFCSGHCFLPDGRLLVAGGQAWNFFPFIGRGADHDIHTFDPFSQSWSRFQDTPAARWYPTCVTLADGTALIAGGDANRYPVANNDEYEIFDGASNALSGSRRFNPGFINGEYPIMKMLPDGSTGGALLVFSINEARLFHPQNATWDPTRFLTISRQSRTYNHQSGCVLLPLLPERPDVVRVLAAGGQGAGDEATNSAEIFEFNRSNPDASFWRPPNGGNMIYRRFMSDAVILPDGSILIVNGAGAGKADNSRDPVMNAELFDPVSETFRALAPINHPRLYHSSAILLPDATVLICGNTRDFNPANPVEDNTIEIFSPPYLFQGARPAIQDVPTEMFYTREHSIFTPSPADITSVVLLRLGSTTHSNNMDQRYVGLLALRRQADRIVVRGPLDTTVAPPGYYMLFLVNSARIPSTAKIVHLGVPTGPYVGLDRTQIDFGDVALCGSGLQDLTISNLGTADLTINSGSVTGAGFAAIVPPQTVVSPASQLVVTVGFTPAAVGGAVGVLTLATDDPTAGSLGVPLTGQGVLKPPTIVASPTTLNFGRIAIGDAKTEAAVIEDAGSSPLTVTVSDPTDPVFTIIERPPQTIECFQRAGLKVSCVAQTVGRISATIKITSNDPNMSSLNLTLVASGFDPNPCQGLDSRLAELQIELRNTREPDKIRIVQQINEVLRKKRASGCP